MVGEQERMTFSSKVLLLLIVHEKLLGVLTWKLAGLARSSLMVCYFIKAAPASRANRG